MSKMTTAFDSLLVMKDAGAITASAAATVSSVAKVLDLGLGNAECDVIIDVSACEVASQDESYRIAVQLSDTAAFTDYVYEVESVQLGASNSDFIDHVNRITGYTLTLDAPVDGLATPTAGIQAISNATGALGTITGATVPALPSRKYTLDVTVDGTLCQLNVALAVTDSWTQIAAKLQVALRAANSASSDTVAISGGKILFTSATTGITSTILIEAGTTKTATTIFGTDDMTTGRYIINFKNCVAEGVVKRYVRLYTHVAGTIATGINYKAYLSRNN